MKKCWCGRKLVIRKVKLTNRIDTYLACPRFPKDEGHRYVFKRTERRRK